MNQLNTLIVEGNLVQDPESKVLASSSTVCTFSIAINRSFKVQEKVQEEVCYILIETWGAQAKNCVQYLKKGRAVRVVGRIKQNRWEDKEGNHRERHLIVAEHVDFLPASYRPNRSEDADLHEEQPQESKGKTKKQRSQTAAVATEEKEVIAM